LQFEESELFFVLGIVASGGQDLCYMLEEVVLESETPTFG
jgi:hypothetical protein